MPQFKVRAELHLGSDERWSCSGCEALGQVEGTISINIGPFRLDWSPNQDFYFSDVYGCDPKSMGDRSIDHDFPVSALMMEMEGELPEQGSSVRLADDELATCELLLRLFQPGDLSIRRHGYVYNPETGSPTFTWMRWGLLTPKPIVEPLYKRPPFHLHDDTVRALQGFANPITALILPAPTRGCPCSRGLGNTQFQREHSTTTLHPLAHSTPTSTENGDGKAKPNAGDDDILLFFRRYHQAEEYTRRWHMEDGPIPQNP